MGYLRASYPGSSQKLGTEPVMGAPIGKGNLRMSNPEKKQAEMCLGLILTNPESR
jgi:hypothetical protein